MNLHIGCRECVARKSSRQGFRLGTLTDRRTFLTFGGRYKSLGGARPWYGAWVRPGPGGRRRPLEWPTSAEKGGHWPQCTGRTMACTFRPEGGRSRRGRPKGRLRPGRSGQSGLAGLSFAFPDRGAAAESIGSAGDLPAFQGAAYGSTDGSTLDIGCVSGGMDGFSAGNKLAFMGVWKRV